MVPIVSVVGRSGSGKTTLIENIIPWLKGKGYRVGAIKHDAHHFDIDHEGKDTWRMSNSGADEVIISSADKIAMVKRIQEEMKLEELASWLLMDVDIIITEGYKAYDWPKIEVVRYNKVITSRDNNLIALIDNTSGDMFSSLFQGYENMINFNMGEKERIAQFIEERFLVKKNVHNER